MNSFCASLLLPILCLSVSELSHHSPHCFPKKTQTCSNSWQGNRFVHLLFTLMKHFGDLTLHLVIGNQMDDFTAQQIPTLCSNKATLIPPSCKREDKEGDITFTKLQSLLVILIVILVLQEKWKKWKEIPCELFYCGFTCSGFLYKYCAGFL